MMLAVLLYAEGHDPTSCRIFLITKGASEKETEPCKG